MAMLKFNPPKEVARYALFVEYNVGKGFFKAYNDLGSTKSSFYHHRSHDMKEARILENVGGEWYTLHLVTPDMDHLPWEKEVESVYGYGSRTYKTWRAIPMTREEYAEWRVKVERERIADLSADLDLNPEKTYSV